MGFVKVWARMMRQMIDPQQNGCEYASFGTFFIRCLGNNNMNKNGFRQFAILLLPLLTFSLFCVAPAHAKKGETDWSLGPTGARGLIEAWKHTAEARKIVITRVASRSPAEGVLKVGDVIIGVEGRDFGGDARVQFANAIMRAEREESGGVLSLVCVQIGRSHV